MKFTIMRDEIYNALQKVVNVIPQRTTFMMTQNVLLFTEDNLLKLVATDLEITLLSWASASIVEEGSIALPGRLLTEIVRELPNIELTFESDSSYRMRITSEFGHYKIAGVNPAEFPQIPDLGEGLKQISLSNEVFRRILENTIFACSTDEIRAALTGVYFDIKPNRLDAVSTDGHRLAKMTFRQEGLSSSEVQAIISARSLNFVLRNLDGEGSTTIYFGKRHALVEMSDTQLFARLIEDTFVDYDRVIPRETPFEMLIDTAEFYASVKRVSLFSNPLTSQVVLHIYPQHIEIHAEDVDYGGEAQERIACQFNGDDFLIAFNSKYLQDVLRHIGTEKMYMKFVRTDYAALALPAETPEDEEQLILLMPVRIPVEEAEDDSL